MGPGMRAIAILVTTLLLLGATASTVDAANPCPDQPTHTYVTGSAAAVASATLFGSSDATATSPAGRVSVWDTNGPQDCNPQDGVPGDWDGDHDWGLGGGAFGYGAWAEDPQCDYQLNVHGPNVVVLDVVFADNMPFVVGEDDRSGPIKIRVFETLDLGLDLESGPVETPDARRVPIGWVCETDGSITPGDPGADPTADPDDCLSVIFYGFGYTCGTGGGDGLTWIFLDGPSVTGVGLCTIENPNCGPPRLMPLCSDVGLNTPATRGTVTAF